MSTGTIVRVAGSVVDVAFETGQLPRLRDCEMHASCMLHSGDEGTLRKLGVRLTCEAEFPSKDLYF